MTRRTERISSLIRQEISDLLREQVNDPRLSSFISITSVSTSPDLKHAKVFVSALGGETSKNEVLQGFTTASGFFRRELARHLRLKHIPELSFHLDDTIERGAEVLRLVEQVASDDTENEDEN